ncbi:MAG: hypothetical protein ACRCV6_06605 [Formosimonas sp.]
MLNPSQVEFIQRAIAQTHHRVFVLEVDGRKMVIKGQEGARNPFRYRMLKTVSTLFRMPVLMPVPAPGGAGAQAIEIKRLTELAQAGVPVPELLHVEPSWIAISYEGERSIGQAIRKNPQPPSVTWEQGLAAILDVHRKGQNLSQVFERNAMWHDNRVVFIDFEDDPALALGLANAQTRDWLFYLYSTAWMLEITPEQAGKVMFKYLLQDSADVQKIMFDSLGALKWLRHLPAKRKPWGRDVMALHRVGKVLFEMSRMAGKA